MTPEQFISKWKGSTLTESQAAQTHFNDLCALLDEPTPAAADPRGEWYCFERGATKTTGGEGWADVWKRGHFGWEYKGKRKDLNAAFVQLQQYAIALENPPLLVVSDMETFIPRDAEAARQLKARTLTNLYNTRGTGEGAWIDALHADLDRAVAAAYGWPEDIATDDALARLLTLNQTRAAR